MTNIYLPEWFYYVAVGLLGAILGSFANVCIVRMPEGKSIVKPPSHCPKCDHMLSWWENIPILSFLALRGKCRQCHAHISFQYPAVELICVLLSIFAWHEFAYPLEYILYFCLFIVPLVIVSFIDLKHRIIPDSISISGIFVGIGVNVVLAGSSMRLQAAIDSLIGAAVGGLSLFLVAYAYEKIKKQEGLGGGDIKLMAMLGAFFGWRAAILMLFMSSVLGSLVGVILILILRKDMKYAIPFGPFLVIAGFIQLFYGERLIYRYLSLFY